jgi:hypothetical protein
MTALRIRSLFLATSSEAHAKPCAVHCGGGHSRTTCISQDGTEWAMDVLKHVRAGCQIYDQAKCMSEIEQHRLSSTL